MKAFVVRVIKEVGGVKVLFSMALLVVIFTSIFIVDSGSHIADISRVNHNWWIGTALISFSYACTLVAFAFLFPRRFSKWFFTILIVWALIIVAVSLFSKINFGISFQGEVALILLNSSWQEVKDFVSLYLNSCWITVSVVFGFMLVSFGWITNKFVYCKPCKWSVMIFAIMFVPWMILHMIFPQHLPEVYGIWERIRPFTLVRYTPFSILDDGYRKIALYRDMVNTSCRPDIPHPITYIGSTKELLCVVIIGESATRNRWSLYGYERDTTPCVNRWAQELFVFKDLVSMAGFTTQSLRYIFSSADANEESTVRYFLPAVCRRGGFEGVLLSTQGHWGVFDGIDAVIFKDCNKKCWLSDGRNGERVYDEELLPLIEDEVRGALGRKVLFVHLQGSHQDVKDRYTSDYAFFGKDETGCFRPTKSDHYDNSIRYTDNLIAEILKMVKNRNCPSLVIYLSDHGESPGSSLWRYVPDPDVWEVPMFIWVSDKYKNLYPTLVDGLKKATGKPLASDQLLQGFARLFLLEGIPDYSPEKDFLSDKFKQRNSRYKTEVKSRRGR